MHFFAFLALPSGFDALTNQINITVTELKQQELSTVDQHPIYVCVTKDSDINNINTYIYLNVCRLPQQDWLFKNLRSCITFSLHVVSEKSVT